MSHYDKKHSGLEFKYQSVTLHWVLMIKEEHINNTMQQVLLMTIMLHRSMKRNSKPYLEKESNSFTKEVRPSWERNRDHLKKNKGMSKDLAIEKQTVNTRDCKWLARLRLRRGDLVSQGKQKLLSRKASDAEDWAKATAVGIQKGTDLRNVKVIIFAQLRDGG